MRRLTSGAFTVGRFDWSPVGRQIAVRALSGLQDVGVPTKLIVYRGFDGIGHGPSKPKSSRTLMQHNLEWFDRYLFGGS